MYPLATGTHKQNKPLPVWRRSAVVSPNVAEPAVTLAFTKLFVYLISMKPVGEREVWYALVAGYWSIELEISTRLYRHDD